MAQARARSGLPHLQGALPAVRLRGPGRQDQAGAAGLDGAEVQARRVGPNRGLKRTGCVPPSRRPPAPVSRRALLSRASAMRVCAAPPGLAERARVGTMGAFDPAAADTTSWSPP